MELNTINGKAIKMDVFTSCIFTGNKDSLVKLCKDLEDMLHDYPDYYSFEPSKVFPDMKAHCDFEKPIIKELTVINSEPVLQLSLESVNSSIKIINSLISKHYPDISIYFQELLEGGTKGIITNDKKQKFFTFPTDQYRAVQVYGNIAEYVCIKN